MSESSCDRVSELWGVEGRESEPPFFGWLDTSIPEYPPTLQLKTHVYLLPRGVHPYSEAKAALGFWHTVPAGLPIPRFPNCSAFLVFVDREPKGGGWKFWRR